MQENEIHIELDDEDINDANNLHNGLIQIGRPEWADIWEVDHPNQAWINNCVIDTDNIHPADSYNQLSIITNRDFEVNPTNPNNPAPAYPEDYTFQNGVNIHYQNDPNANTLVSLSNGDKEADGVDMNAVAPMSSINLLESVDLGNIVMERPEGMDADQWIQHQINSNPLVEPDSVGVRIRDGEYVVDFSLPSGVNIKQTDHGNKYVPKLYANTVSLRFDAPVLADDIDLNRIGRYGVGNINADPATEIYPLDTPNTVDNVEQRSVGNTLSIARLDPKNGQNREEVSVKDFLGTFTVDTRSIIYYLQLENHVDTRSTWETITTISILPNTDEGFGENFCFKRAAVDTTISLYDKYDLFIQLVESDSKVNKFLMYYNGNDNDGEPQFTETVSAGTLYYKTNLAQYHNGVAPPTGNDKIDRISFLAYNKDNVFSMYSNTYTGRGQTVYGRISNSYIEFDFPKEIYLIAQEGDKPPELPDNSGVILQENKEVWIYTNGDHPVKPEAGKDAMKEVTVHVNVANSGNQSVEPNKLIQITDNGTHMYGPSSGYTSMGNVTVSVDVDQTVDANLEEDKRVEYTSNGTYNVTATPNQGYDGLENVIVKVNVPQTDGGSNYNLENEVDYIANERGDFTINPDTGYDGMKKVNLSVRVPELKIDNKVEKTYTANGSYEIDPASGSQGIAGATVTVRVPQPNIEAETDYTVTNNGDFTVSPSDNYSATKKVNLSVRVPQPKIGDRVIQSVTNNGTINIDPSNGDSGIAGATVNVELPLETNKDYGTVTTNGPITIEPTHGNLAMKKATVNVNVPKPNPVLKTLSIDNAEVHTYNNPGTGYDGYGPVNVNIPVGSLTINSLENTTYTPDYNSSTGSGKKYFSSVDVSLPIENKVTKTIRSNGDTTIIPTLPNQAMKEVGVNVQVPIQDAVSVEYTDNDTYYIDPIVIPSTDSDNYVSDQPNRLYKGIKKATVTVNVPMSEKTVSVDANSDLFDTVDNKITVIPDSGDKAMTKVTANIALQNEKVISAADIDSGNTTANANSETGNPLGYKSVRVDYAVEEKTDVELTSDDVNLDSDSDDYGQFTVTPSDDKNAMTSITGKVSLDPELVIGPEEISNYTEPLQPDKGNVGFGKVSINYPIETVTQASISQNGWSIISPTNGKVATEGVEMTVDTRPSIDNLYINFYKNGDTDEAKSALLNLKKFKELFGGENEKHIDIPMHSGLMVIGYNLLSENYVFIFHYNNENISLGVTISKDIEKFNEAIYLNTITIDNFDIGIMDNVTADIVVNNPSNGIIALLKNILITGFNIFEDMTDHYLYSFKFELSTKDNKIFYNIANEFNDEPQQLVIFPTLQSNRYISPTQNTKEFTVTTNGTTTIEPDNGYGAMGSVSLSIKLYLNSILYMFYKNTASYSYEFKFSEFDKYNNGSTITIPVNQFAILCFVNDGNNYVLNYYYNRTSTNYTTTANNNCIVYHSTIHTDPAVYRNLYRLIVKYVKDNISQNSLYYVIEQTEDSPNVIIKSIIINKNLFSIVNDNNEELL